MPSGTTSQPSERIAALEARLAALATVVEQQAAELSALRSSAPTPAPGARSDAAAPADASAGPAIGRRRLLVGGATAAVATATAVAAGAAPAAAANGDALILGSEANASTAPTVLTRTSSSFDPVLRVASVGNGPAIAASTNATTNYALTASGPLGGVFGSSTDGPGTFGYTYAEGQAGVYGTCTETFVADGVKGASTLGRGVYGVSTSGNGVEGTGAIGVRGTSVTGTGVQAYAESGVGLVAGSGESAAIQAIGVGGPAIIATSPVSNLSLAPTDARPAPTADAMAHTKGEVVTDAAGNLWICVADGIPGTWRKAAGPTSAGTFHLLPVPVRVYDSRPGTSPAVGSKTKLAGNTARTLAMSANGSGVPNGATAVSVTLLLVNASSAGGNVTIWATGASRPQANAMVWGGSAGRFASTAISRIDATTRLNVAASASTDLALDVVGYYL